MKNIRSESPHDFGLDAGYQSDEDLSDLIGKMNFGTRQEMLSRGASVIFSTTDDEPIADFIEHNTSEVSVTSTNNPSPIVMEVQLTKLISQKRKRTGDAPSPNGVTISPSSIFSANYSIPSPIAMEVPLAKPVLQNRKRGLDDTPSSFISNGEKKHKTIAERVMNISTSAYKSMSNSIG